MEKCPETEKKYTKMKESDVAIVIFRFLTLFLINKTKFQFPQFPQRSSESTLENF